MRVAVVGAAGFIGGRFVEWLREGDRAEVVPIARSLGSTIRLSRHRLNWRVADALDEDALTRAFEGCDVVFLCVTGDTEAILEAPGKTARAASRAGVRRVVYLSSVAAYGPQMTAGMDDETPVDVNQTRDYNRNKAIAEKRVEALRGQLGLDIVMLRPTIVFGPRSTHFTVRIAYEVLNGRAYLVDGGSGICNALFVDNLCAAMWQAGIVPAARNQNFVISDRERVTWADLYGAVADAAGVSREAIPQISEAHGRSVRVMPLGPVQKVVRSMAVKRLRSYVPFQYQERLRGAVRAALDVRESESFFWNNGQARIDPVVVELQTCRYQMPIAKAERVLGYDPISTQEGFRRTGEWLQALGFTS